MFLCDSLDTVLAIEYLKRRACNGLLEDHDYTFVNEQNSSKSKKNHENHENGSLVFFFGPGVCTDHC